MNDCLERLRKELIVKMSQNDWNITDLSIKCDISYHAMCNIINGVSKDMRLSTFVNICENANISYAEIFDIDDSDVLENALERIVLSCDKGKYQFRML